jgi:hypothetical protein
MVIPGMAATTMIPISIRGTVLITAVIMTLGVIHGAILIIVQDGQAHLVSIGVIHGIMDGEATLEWVMDRPSAMEILT